MFFQADSTNSHAGTPWCWEPEKNLMISYIIISLGVKGQANCDHIFNVSADFTVQLREEKYPEIWFNDKWSPICGHYFWNNNYGATLFCQELDSTYTFGSIKNSGIPLASDGIRVGKCTSQDNSLSSCTTLACTDWTLSPSRVERGKSINKFCYIFPVVRLTDRVLVDIVNIMLSAFN